MIRFTYDIFNRSWSGSGDNRLNDVIYDRYYYTEKIDKSILSSTITNWFVDEKNRNKERTKISNPTSESKLLLDILYSNNFSYQQSVGDTVYDYEHLVTKNIIRKQLQKYDKNDTTIGLPGGSIGNICLLPEYDNLLLCKEF